MTAGPLPAPSKWQIWIATNNRDVPHGDENKVSGYGYGLWCGFKWEPHHATSHLRSRLESQHQSVLGCAEECSDPLVQSGGRWQTPGCDSRTLAPAHKSKETQAWFQKECYDFVPFSHWPLSSSRPSTRWTTFVWSYVENITNMNSHNNTKPRLIPNIRRVVAELPSALVEKACSQFRIRIEAVIEAEGGYIE